MSKFLYMQQTTFSSCVNMFHAYCKLIWTSSRGTVRVTRSVGPRRVRQAMLNLVLVQRTVRVTKTWGLSEFWFCSLSPAYVSFTVLLGYRNMNLSNCYVFNDRVFLTTMSRVSVRPVPRCAGSARRVPSLPWCSSASLIALRISLCVRCVFLPCVFLCDSWYKTHADILIAADAT